MNKRGFTLVELLATIIVLSIVLGIALVGANGGFQNAKRKTEDVFVKTIEDALVMYIDSNDSKRLNISSSSSNSVCKINKRFGEINVYKASDNLTFADIMNSEYTPLVEGELVNPANEDVTCLSSAPVSIYRDEDYVYYYKVDKEDFRCLKTTGLITNLPDGCDE